MPKIRAISKLLYKTYNGITFQNRDEIDYAKYLDLRLAAGEIKSWKYEAFSLNLNGAMYKPDFYVILSDLTIQIVEVKGMRREAGMMRFNLAKKQFPEFHWDMVTARRKSGKVWFEKIK